MKIEIEEFGDGKVMRPWLVLRPESPAEELVTAKICRAVNDSHAVSTQRLGLTGLAVRLHQSGMRGG